MIRVTCDICESDVTPQKSSKFIITGVKVEDICSDCRDILAMSMDLMCAKNTGAKTSGLYISSIREAHEKFFPDQHKKE